MPRRPSSRFSRIKNALRTRHGKLSIEEMVMLLGAVGLFTAGIMIAWMMSLSIPSIDEFHSRKVIESTKIFDRTGKVLLYDVHGTVRRTAIPLTEVSLFAKNATIAIEDTHFYEHVGIRPTAIVRAVWTNFTTGELLGGQGGSTITQQVVKNTLLSKEKTITRKLKEWVLALKLERVLTKDQILEIYLNETPYGGTIYGIEEASGYFFAKKASELTLGEAAYLAALPQRPTYFSPYGNHRDALEKRKNLVLAKMLENGFITQAQHDAAAAEEIEFQPQSNTGIKAPHFVFYVREYLELKYGVQAVNEQGLKVITSLDWELQQKGEEIVSRWALQNEKNFNAENAGLVAIDPTTGQILTMVGSRGYFDEEIDGAVNVALASRQPGSSFKPFVYAAALEKGYTPETVVFDVKTQFSTACAPSNLSGEYPCYSPDNYDNTFKGPITFRNALAQSINVAAVKVLYLAGIDPALDIARRLGITTLVDKERYGLTLVLGGGEVNLLELTSAYSVFANDGLRNPATPILRVEDSSGNMLEEFVDQSRQAIDPQIARQISDMLSDNDARIPAFGANSPLNFPGKDVAAKTGTTNDYRDVWISGYSPRVAAAAWAGNNDNTPLVRKVASFVIAPMWHEFMEIALEKYPGGEFVEPDPIPTDVPPVLRGEWNTNPAEGVHDILYWVNKDNPRSGVKPSNPWSDSQFALWEYPISGWSTGATTTPGGGTAPGVPGQFSITSPAPNGQTTLNQFITISVSHPDVSSLTRVSYYFNGQFIGASTAAPFSLSYVPRQTGAATIRAVAEGSQGLQEATVTFIVN